MLIHQLTKTADVMTDGSAHHTKEYQCLGCNDLPQEGTEERGF